MANFNNTGQNVAPRVTFNSGTIDFGLGRLVEVDSVAMNIEWTTNPLYVLGSIVPQALNRSSQKISITGKIKSFPAEMAAIAMGSSQIGTPVNLSPLDGQPTLTSPVFTFFDSNAKEYQYQVSGALFKSFKANMKMEDYGEFDFEIEAISLVLLYTA